MSDEAIKAKVKVGPVSGEIALTENAPGLLAMVMPKRVAKARLHQALLDTVIDRMRSGESTDADAEFMKDVLGESAAKLVRRGEIAARAERALAAMPAVEQLPPISDAPETEAGARRLTAEDWISRFWDDAGLVSDEALQEIYAHILASEARAAGSCSLGTLRVLSYMDRQTADGFAKALPLVVNSEWLPDIPNARRRFGYDVPYDLLVELSDAGLFESRPVMWGPAHNIDHAWFVYGDLILRVLNWRRSPLTNLSVFRLTKAGRELARVAQVNRPREVFFGIGRWVRTRVGDPAADTTVTWAEMPPDRKVENVNVWKALPSETSA